MVSPLAASVLVTLNAWNDGDGSTSSIAVAWSVIGRSDPDTDRRREGAAVSVWRTGAVVSWIVTVHVLVFVSDPASVTLSVIVWTPTPSVTVGVAPVASRFTPSSHSYVVRLLSGSVDDVPSNCTSAPAALVASAVMFPPTPATGGWLYPTMTILPGDGTP